MIVVNVCLSVEESIDHLILICLMAFQIWSSVLNWFWCNWVLPRCIFDQFDAWKLQIGSPKGRKMWRLSFFATFWAIWKERNCRCFEGKCSSITDVVVLHHWFLFSHLFGVCPSMLFCLKQTEVAFSELVLLLCIFWLLMQYFLGACFVCL